MSEEFFMNVSFELPDANRIEQLETLIEHLDLSETDEARTLLGGYKLAEAQAMIENLTAKHSYYPNGYDLVQMYEDTYNDSVDDFELEIEVVDLKAEISVEGHDREADDFCSALVLVLIAIGARRINAKAGAPMWNATWSESDQGVMKLDFESEV